MSENDTKKDLLDGETAEKTENTGEEGDWVKEFAMAELELAPVSSAEFLKKSDDILSLNEPETPPQTFGEKDVKAEDADIQDPVFKELAEPKLPEPAKENRARLQMQSPNRIQFYWSIKNNPFQTLSRALGNAGSYTLVAKLINQTNEREEIMPVEAEGSTWFNVDADSSYQAEIGFYAPNRPYVRIMFSNVLETPRKSPSPRAATEADWAISAREFAEVLDYSGFAQDAFEVALAGDDLEASTNATHSAFSQFIEDKKESFAAIGAEEIRLALLAIASGYSLEDLRGHIGAALFAILENNIGRLTVENAISALGEHFDISMEDVDDEEETQFIGEKVFGASLVHFPKGSKRVRTSPKTRLPKNLSLTDSGGKISPVSSFRFQFRE